MRSGLPKLADLCGTCCKEPVLQASMRLALQTMLACVAPACRLQMPHGGFRARLQFALTRASPAAGYKYYGLNRGEHEGKTGIWYREWAPGARVSVFCSLCPVCLLWWLLCSRAAVTRQSPVAVWPAGGAHDKALLRYG